MKNSVYGRTTVRAVVGVKDDSKTFPTREKPSFSQAYNRFFSLSIFFGEHKFAYLKLRLLSY